MSNNFNVHIALTRIPSLEQKDSEIYGLRVEGVTTSLEALSSHIAAVKNVCQFVCNQ